MLIIGCDFHPSFQQVAIFDQQTGEYQEKRLGHRQEAESFYRSRTGRAVRVGMEACGHYPWFEGLLAECGHELWLGDAGQIRASVVRKQKTDRRDAEQILRLLMEDRFPKIWVPSLEERDARQLLVHRHKQVQARTRVKNQLQSLALSQGVQGGVGTVALAALRRRAAPASAQKPGSDEPRDRRVGPARGRRSSASASGLTIDDTPGRGAGDGACHGADGRTGGTVRHRRPTEQLLRVNPAGAQFRRAAAVRTDQQARQSVSAILAGRGGTDGSPLRCGTGTLLSPPGGAQASRVGQGGGGPQAGHAVVLDVARRLDVLAAEQGRMQVSPGHFVAKAADRLCG